METQNLTCALRDYLINALQNFPCDGTTPGQPEIPDGFELDPESEVIFDPESEVIFDPESEVIFDRRLIFHPEDGQPNFSIFQNIYDSYGYKINVKLSRIDLIKLLYWSFKVDAFNQSHPPTGAGT